ENPAQPGEYRVFNQFQDLYDVSQLSQIVQRVAGQLGLHVLIRPLENPRCESEEHYYKADHQALFDLGYRPTRPIETEVQLMLADLLPHRERILEKQHALIPDIRWDGRISKVAFLEPVPTTLSHGTRTPSLQIKSNGKGRRAVARPALAPQDEKTEVH
ncbi:MAG TPA: hypothetical protein VNO32_26250, partial [Candidatus Acidoferrum sp.]|nr:hypothetical protein [Candidatus Acidoferrum sp.]